MSAADWGLPDVGYTGATDTVDGFSGSTTLQDSVVGQPNLTLDGSTTDYSVVDMGYVNDPYATQALSGSTDPPIGSLSQSQPVPVYTPPSGSTSNALNALGKFGYTFAALLGGTPHTTLHQPVQAGYSVPQFKTGIQANGSSTAILLILVVAGIILIARGGDL